MQAELQQHLLVLENMSHVEVLRKELLIDALVPIFHHGQYLVQLRQFLRVLGHVCRQDEA